jgi:DUF917 family protein
VWLAGVLQIDSQLKAERVTPDPVDAAAAELAIRDNLGQFGNAAGLVCWGQTGAQLRTSPYLLAHTLTKLIDFGAAAAATGFTKDNLISFLAGRSDVIATYTGIVTAIEPGSEPGYDDGYVIVSAPYDLQYQIHYLNENMIVTSGVDRTKVIATAPSAIAMLFQPTGSSTYQLLNNGDNLPNQSVIGNPIIFCVLAESCVLFKPGIADSFATVLKDAPFNYGGAFVPPGTCTS